MYIYITGRGVPNNLEREDNQITSIPNQVIPETDEAAQMYRTQGGELGIFGCDPLKDRADLVQRREAYFLSAHPTFQDIFSNVVSGNGARFYDALLDFIRVTKSLQ